MSWVHLEDKIVTASKPHRCYLCDRTIAKGERYLRRSGIEEGEGYITAKMHLECEEHTRDWDDGDWEAFSRGDLANWIEEPEAKGGEA